MNLETLDFFDPLEVGATNTTQEEEKSDSRKKEHRSHRRQTEMVEIPDRLLWRTAYGVQQFLDIMGLTPPKPGYSIHCITGGNVDMIAYLQYLLLHYPHMKRVTISTWCLGGREIKMMEEWNTRGRIDHYDMLCGEHCKSQYKVEWAMLERLKEKDVVQGLVCSTIHSKIILCETDTHKIVVETSSNFNMNPRVEQGCITINDDLYDFYRNYFEKIIK